MRKVGERKSTDADILDEVGDLLAKVFDCKGVLV